MTTTLITSVDIAVVERTQWKDTIHRAFSQPYHLAQIPSSKIIQAYLYLFRWGGHYCLMHCNLFRSIVLPPNLGITRTWICWLILLGGQFFEAWGSLTSLISQTRDPQLKVPSRGLVLRIFESWKNPSTSAGIEPANLGSQGEHVTPRPPKLTTGLSNIPGMLFKHRNG